MAYLTRDGIVFHYALADAFVVIVTYDENDGFLDHSTPPPPAAVAQHGMSTVSTANEYHPGSAGNLVR